MSTSSFNTRNDTYRKLMGNGLSYRIPHFQRDYSWTDEEWEDLWQDILEIMRTPDSDHHYMGYLVLQSGSTRELAIIDGQQRLTTLTLIILAILRLLRDCEKRGENPEANKERAEYIHNTYVGDFDVVSLTTKSKLRLNRNNNEYFQTYIVPLRDLPTQGGFSPSTMSLRRAYLWFQGRIEKDYISSGTTDVGQKLAQLVEGIADKLFFTVIEVTDELNAYKVFETLNSRGVRLSSTDLLKNYLFSVLVGAEKSEADVSILENRWEGMVNRLGGENFTDYVRVFWISRFSFVRKTDLFKQIRKQIKDRPTVFNLIRMLEDDLENYLSLKNPENTPSSEAQENARTLKLFSITQPIPLLLAAKRVLNQADFDRVLYACVIISFRYNIIGNRPPNEQEDLYHRLCKEMNNGDIKTASQVIERLRPVYPSDEQFRSDFAAKSLMLNQARGKGILRYILGKLEKHLGNPISATDSRYNIEHILPVNPGEGWEHMNRNETINMVFRLGNMTLLETAINRDSANMAFTEKKALYQKSCLKLPQKIAAEHEEWTAENILQQQDWMATQAKSIWQLSQLTKPNS